MNQLIGFHIFLFQYALLIYADSLGPRCHECTHIPSARDCTRVTQCGIHEQCYVEEYLTTAGLRWYDSGCKAKERCHRTSMLVGKRRKRIITNDVLICQECCNGDYCNTVGCGEKGFPPKSLRGPVCFSCIVHKLAHTCDQIAMCQPHEQCFLEYLPNTLADPVFTSGCKPESFCNGVDYHTHSSCTGCCTDDYCNRNCSALVYNRQTSPNIQFSHTTATTQPMKSSTLVQTTMSPSTPRSTARITTTLTIEVKCRLKHYTYASSHNLCYRMHTQRRTWSQARTACQTEGGDLLIIKDQATLDYLGRSHFYGEDYNHDRYWIGARDTIRENTWEWVNGHPVPFSFFHPGEPNNRDGNHHEEDCGTAVFRGDDQLFKLNDDYCELYYQYICQLPTNSNAGLINTVAPTATYQDRCRNHGYTYVDSYHLCYKIHEQDKLTWSQARGVCIQESGDLLIIDSQATLDYLNNLHFYGHNNDRDRYWVGAIDVIKEGTWEWVNSHPVPASFFHSDEPNNHDTSHHEEDCGTIEYRDDDKLLKMNDDYCEANYRFLCQI